jgi:hypothetical protein
MESNGTTHPRRCGLDADNDPVACWISTQVHVVALCVKDDKRLAWHGSHKLGLHSNVSGQKWADWALD